MSKQLMKNLKLICYLVLSAALMVGGWYFGAQKQITRYETALTYLQGMDATTRVHQDIRLLEMIRLGEMSRAIEELHLPLGRGISWRVFAVQMKRIRDRS